MITHLRVLTDLAGPLLGLSLPEHGPHQRHCSQVPKRRCLILSGSSSVALLPGTKGVDVHLRTLHHLLKWDNSGTLLLGSAVDRVGERASLGQPQMIYEQWRAVHFTPRPSLTSYLVHPKRHNFSRIHREKHIHITFTLNM